MVPTTPSPHAGYGKVTSCLSTVSRWCKGEDIVQVYRYTGDHPNVQVHDGRCKRLLMLGWLCHWIILTLQIRLTSHFANTWTSMNVIPWHNPNLIYCLCCTLMTLDFIQILYSPREDLVLGSLQWCPSQSVGKQRGSTQTRDWTHSSRS